MYVKGVCFFKGDGETATMVESSAVPNGNSPTNMSGNMNQDNVRDFRDSIRVEMGENSMTAVQINAKTANA